MCILMRFSWSLDPVIKSASTHISHFFDSPVNVCFVGLEEISIELFSLTSMQRQVAEVLN